MGTERLLRGMVTFVAWAVLVLLLHLGTAKAVQGFRVCRIVLNSDLLDDCVVQRLALL